MLRRRLPSGLLLAAALLSAGCVTDSETPYSEESSGKIELQEDDNLRRALPELDRLTIEYFRLLGHPGEVARNRRRVMRPGIEGRVARHDEALLRLATDEKELVRRQIAVKALAFSKDVRAVEVLSNCLKKSADPRLLTSATYSLSRIRSPTTPIEPLLDLVTHPDADVRNNTLLTLWHVFEAKRSAGVTVIDETERDRARSLIELQLVDLYDSGVRENAAAALGGLRDPRSLDALINQLSDSSPRVRTHVAIALGKLGDLRAVDPLLSRMDDAAEGFPRQMIANAITQLVEERGIEVPEYLGTDGARWARFLNENLPDRVPTESR